MRDLARLRLLPLLFVAGGAGALGVALLTVTGTGVSDTAVCRINRLSSISTRIILSREDGWHIRLI